jgi:hypothetical protein
MIWGTFQFADKQRGAILRVLEAKKLGTAETRGAFITDIERRLSALMVALEDPTDESRISDQLDNLKQAAERLEKQIQRLTSEARQALHNPDLFWHIKSDLEDLFAAIERRTTLHGDGRRHRTGPDTGISREFIRQVADAYETHLKKPKATRTGPFFCALEIVLNQADFLPKDLPISERAQAGVLGRRQ